MPEIYLQYFMHLFHCGAMCCSNTLGICQQESVSHKETEGATLEVAAQQVFHTVNKLSPKMKLEEGGCSTSQEHFWKEAEKDKNIDVCGKDQIGN